MIAYIKYKYIIETVYKTLNKKVEKQNGHKD